MTVSSTIEARLRRRAASTAPARATAKALGIAEFEDDIARARFNDLSHWGYGTGLGRRARAARRGRAWRRRARPPRTARRSGAARRSRYPRSTSPRRSSSGASEEVAIDLFHHTVYAVATGVAYEAIAAGRRNGHA